MGNKSMENGGVEYLQMIQGIIDRMSTSSAVFKGFTATIVAGISALSFADTNKWVLLLSFVPILCFTYLDTYYLQLERRYRALFDQVRLGKHPINFDLEPLKNKDILKANKHAQIGFVSCLFSRSIIWFYFPLAIISVIVITLKFGGWLS